MMRQRKGVAGNHNGDACKSLVSSPELSQSDDCSSQNVFVPAAATVVVVYLGFHFAQYLKQLHENEMFFSAIQVN